TDIYSLGILAYTLLAGHPPFESESTEEILRGQLHEALPPLQTVRPDIPDRIEDVIKWALAKQPTDRPTNAGMFARALRAAAGGRGSAGTAWRCETAHGPARRRLPPARRPVPAPGSGAPGRPPLRGPRRGAPPPPPATPSPPTPPPARASPSMPRHQPGRCRS